MNVEKKHPVGSDWFVGNFEVNIKNKCKAVPLQARGAQRVPGS